MTPEVQIKRPLFQSTRSKYNARRFAHATSGGDLSFIDTLTDCASSDHFEVLRNQKGSRLSNADLIRDENQISQSNSIQEANSATPTNSPLHLSSATNESSISPITTRPGTLKRALRWLQKNYSQRTSKQLRVCETVSLGEKRFIAIIHVENRKFLIGGGASNVALLTQLGEAGESSSSSVSEILPRLRGVN
jgi:hypothetical protein